MRDDPAILRAAIRYLARIVQPDEWPRGARWRPRILPGRAADGSVEPATLRPTHGWAQATGR